MGRQLIVERDYIIPEDELLSRANFDLNDFFENRAPLEVEIGTGKGRVLLYLAKRFPSRNFVGIEWANKYYRYAADRLRRWQVRNAKMLRADARELFIDRLKDNTVDAVHVYFPDPWPKKRHHKRRLFIPEFCYAVLRVLRSEGKVYIATDYKEYSDMILENMLGTGGFCKVEYDSPEGSEVRTNYEDKWIKEGREIYRLAFLKKR